MSIIVADFYESNKKNDIHVLTDEVGIKRKIEGVVLLDYEPSEKELKSAKGKVVITSLIFAKDDYNRAHKIICELADNGVVALGIKSVYYASLEEETLRYAKSKDLSIFLFGYNVYYENIVTDIYKMLKDSNGRKHVEQKVNSIVSLGAETETLRDLIFSVNEFLNEKHLVVYLKAKEQTTIKEDVAITEAIKKRRILTKYDSVFPFRKGVLLIISSDKLLSSISPESPKSILSLISNLGFDTAKHYIGISEISNSLDLINVTIKQSLFAVKYCEHNQINSIFFDEMGIYRVAFPLLESPWGRNYYTNIIGKIKKYDEEHDTDLMETTEEYIKNSGNIKKISDITYQHENTIRYKIKKVKSLLNIDEKDVRGGVMFYTEINLAIIISELLKNRF